MLLWGICVTPAAAAALELPKLRVWGTELAWLAAQTFDDGES